MEQRLITKAQAAEYCGLSTQGFSNWVDCGKVPGPLPETRRWDRKALDLALGNPMNEWLRVEYCTEPQQAALEIDTFLYRLISKDGELLYIGISYDVETRLTQHQREKEWYREVRECVCELFPSRHKASSAEIEAIRNEHPKYNSTYKTREQ